jgi:hypothetical protein
MARIDFPVWTVSRAALAMPFRYPLALLKFGLLPLLLATICLPPALNVGYTTDVTVGGNPTASTGEMYSLTDNELGLRDLLGFILMLPFAAAFAAAWNRLVATGDEASMGRAPIAFDARTISVILAFLRLVAVVFGLVLGCFVVSLLAFGRYHDGSFSYSYNVSSDGVGAALAMITGVLAVALIFAWFMLRLALVIPAGAMGAPISLWESWRLTEPVQFRLLGAMAVLTIVLALLNILFSLATALMMAVAGVQATFYAAVVLYFPLLVYAHAIWAGLLGATYGLLRPAETMPYVAKVFD